MIKEIKFFIALLFSGLCLSASAQSPTPMVRAMLDRDSITIGDRFTLTIEVEKDLVQSLFFIIWVNQRRWWVRLFLIIG